jgi:uncharacterized membrane protein
MQEPSGNFLAIGYWLLALLAFVIRSYRLDVQSIWFDEGWSWHLARMPLSEMATTTAGDRSPVLYYTLLRLWLQLAGASEFAMRYVSLIADVITVALVLAMGRLMSGGARGQGSRGVSYLVAGLLYAVCPFAVFYAQETRMYALVSMYCTASSYALLRWLRQTRANKPGFFKKPGLLARELALKWLIISAVCLALAIHSHYYAVFLLPAHALVVVLTGRNRTNVIRWCMAAVCIVLSMLPWLLVARGGFAYDDGFQFPLNTIDGRMLEWLRSFANGGFGYALPDLWVWLLLAAGGVGLMGFAWAKRWREMFWLAMLVVVPLLAATVAVRVVYPYRSVFHPRYLIYIAPMACVLLASATPKSVLARAFCLVPCALCLYLWLPQLQIYFTQPNAIRDDYRAATQHVVEALEPNDLVVMTRDNYAIRYYWPPDNAGKLLAAPEGLHGVLDANDLTKLLTHLQTQSPSRARLMLWQDNVVDAQKQGESLFWANGYQIGEYNFGQIRLPLYQVTQTPMQPLAFTPVEAVFGDTLALKSFWMRREARANDWFYLVLTWQPLQPLPKDYKVFVHVMDSADQIAFQKDKLAIDELQPMSRWNVGEVLRDPYAIVVPAELPAGEYRVVVGVYDPETGQRLQTKMGDTVMLGTFNVVSR